MRSPATPLERAPAGLADGAGLWLKREDLHPLGAFKWRGAEPVVAGLRDAGATAVVTASTGNHGAATAWAAGRAGLRAVVFAPAGASATKLERMRELGAEVRLTGADLDEAKAAAVAFARESGARFFEDGAEPAQYEAYRAIAAEILEQSPAPPATVIAPLGNGALAAGVGLELADAAPATRLVVAVAEAAPVMALSLAAGRPVRSRRCETFADGLAVRVAVPIAVETLRPLVDDVVMVSEREIAAGVGAYAAAGIRAEGAAGAALAALGRVRAEAPVVIIVSGANIDEELHRRAVRRPRSFPGPAPPAALSAS